MINRAAMILKYKEPAIKWINDADPYNDDPGITKASVNSERTVYLLREDVAEDPDSLDEWIKMNVDVLFERELSGWYNDPDLWPKNRNYTLFKKWFSVECHTVIEDTVDEPLLDVEF